MKDGALDSLVRAAQDGKAESLERLLRALRAPLLRFARGLGGARIAEDAVQEALLDIGRGIGGYRWEASFLSWAYAVCARRVARHARADAARLSAMAKWIEESVQGPAEPFEQHEEILLAQNAHLACALVVAGDLPPLLRRAYLLGEALGVEHRVGAELCDCTEPTFRQRLSRARAAVRQRIRGALDEVSADDEEIQTAAAELDRLVRLGDLAKARRQQSDAAAIERAIEIVAPSLFEPTAFAAP
jgi:RNA polymerase sigma factor (sigma-70 family)